ncbi:hypothetical protein ACO0RG_004401 [Hanseniaspora osmophila]|uniref:Protein YOP1 n=1 Tax=Hanseniaspora osmophila TaxID=56408 RepID=A0A1E5RA53_9ASCO|nr:Protein YOP1 [Hanseniaspora osmophila]
MASPVINQVKTHMNTLDQKLAGNNLLDTFERKTSYPRSYAVIGFAVFYLILIIFNLGGMGQLLCNFIGFVVPTYNSLKALRTQTKNDDSDLLVYWVVYASFTIAEFWVNTILRWVPFYFLFKTLFLTYIAFPQFGGAQVVYQAFIQPLSERYIFKTGTTNPFSTTGAPSSNKNEQYPKPPTPPARSFENETTPINVGEEIRGTTTGFTTSNL